MTTHLASHNSQSCCKKQQCRCFQHHFVCNTAKLQLSARSRSHHDVLHEPQIIIASYNSFSVQRRNAYVLCVNPPNVTLLQCACVSTQQKSHSYATEDSCMDLTRLRQVAIVSVAKPASSIPTLHLRLHRTSGCHKKAYRNAPAGARMQLSEAALRTHTPRKVQLCASHVRKSLICI